MKLLRRCNNSPNQLSRLNFITFAVFGNCFLSQLLMFDLFIWVSISIPHALTFLFGMTKSSLHRDSIIKLQREKIWSMLQYRTSRRHVNVSEEIRPNRCVQCWVVWASNSHRCEELSRNTWNWSHSKRLRTYAQTDQLHFKF